MDLIESENSYPVLEFKRVASTPDGQEIIDMIVHKGVIYVATGQNVYFLNEDEKLERVPFEPPNTQE